MKIGDRVKINKIISQHEYDYLLGKTGSIYDITNDRHDILDIPYCYKIKFDDGNITGGISGNLLDLWWNVDELIIEYELPEELFKI